MSKKLNHPILHIPTRDEVASLKIGDYSLDCFGQMAEVVRVSFRGQDMLGRAYVGYYTRSRSGNGSTSMSIKQGCITRTAALSCKYTSDEIDEIEANMTAHVVEKSSDPADDEVTVVSAIVPIEFDEIDQAQRDRLRFTN